jgi:hypothetical protein
MHLLVIHPIAEANTVWKRASSLSLVSSDRMIHRMTAEGMTSPVPEMKHRKTWKFLKSTRNPFMGWTITYRAFPYSRVS